MLLGGENESGMDNGGNEGVEGDKKRWTSKSGGTEKVHLMRSQAREKLKKKRKDIRNMWGKWEHKEGNFNVVISSEAILEVGPLGSECVDMEITKIGTFFIKHRQKQKG